MMARKRIGLALSGGAARGPAHLGVLRVLEREQIPIDVVAGVSAGSVAGALYCAGISLDAMTDAMKDFSWHRIASLVFPRHALLSFEKLEKYLIKWIGDVWFGELKKPFAVGTTDLLTGRAVTFTAGRVAPLVRASCSIPGLIEPLEYGSYWLADGGMSCNLPSQAARQLGADVVIGVDLMKPYVRRNFGAPGLASTALEIMVRHSGGGVESADVVISPALDNKTYSRFSRYREMIELGEQAAEAALPALRAKL
jgi:NTE family protein